jgi:predicted mannosyl-3-phosphoglycerate phosphatase (HAD superfamily)
LEFIFYQYYHSSLIDLDSTIVWSSDYDLDSAIVWSSDYESKGFGIVTCTHKT